MPLSFHSEFHPLVIRTTDWLAGAPSRLSLAHRVQGPFHPSTHPSCAHPPLFFPTVSRGREGGAFSFRIRKDGERISLTADGSWLTYRCVVNNHILPFPVLPPSRGNRNNRLFPLSLSLPLFSTGVVVREIGWLVCFAFAPQLMVRGKSPDPWGMLSSCSNPNLWMS